MMNLSSLSKATYACITTATTSFAGAAVFFLTGKTINHISGVCYRVGWGDFEVRVDDAMEGGDLHSSLININHLIDRTDAFMREAAASQKAIRDNKYYRRIQPEGFGGSYLHKSKTINDAIVAISRRVGAFEANTADFEKAINGIADGLSESAMHMAETSRSMNQSATATDESASAAAASEVKSLANQTATAQISEHIQEVQNATQEAVNAFDSVHKTVEQIEEITNVVANSATEQSTATNEIAQNVEQAFAGTQEVTRNISDVSNTASGTGKAARDALEATEHVSTRAGTITEEVNRFIVSLRQGPMDRRDANSASTYTGPERRAQGAKEKEKAA